MTHRAELNRTSRMPLVRKTGLASLALGLVCGCSQSGVPPSARIEGTYSMVVVNDLLFVTSAERSELRVLDLRASPREFVRAPNPLQPLSIPVLDHPVSLARDLDYQQGAEVVGPYVYAQGAASNQISIVGTNRATQLFEFKPGPGGDRWTAPGMVSAIAARGPASAGQPSTLYFATVEGQTGRVWQVDVSPVDPITGKITVGNPRQLLPDPLDPVSALLVMPAGVPPETPGPRIVVATRTPGKPAGQTFLLNTDSKQREALNFSSPVFSTPVRMLATHPAAANLAAGARVFGVLDEDACGDNSDCPGILAVEALHSSGRFGMRSHDQTGSPMVSLRLAPVASQFVLITGLAIAPNVPLAVQKGQSVASTPPQPLVGFVSTSGGFFGGENAPLFFFDAVALSVFDTSASDAPAQVSSVSYQSSEPDAGILRSTDPNYVPGPLPPGGGDGGIPVAHGAALAETILATYQGTIPGFRDLPLDGGQLLAAGSLTSRLVAGAEGDRIQLDGGNCVSEVGLLAIDADAGVLVPNQSFSCPDGGTFSVRAGGNQPYVVEGTASGYMGRTSKNQNFAFPGPELPELARRYSRFYYHPPGFDGGMPPPQIEFQMGPGAPNIQRDSRYLMTVEPHYFPEFIRVSLSLGLDFRLPGSVVFVGTPGGLEINRFFVVYPSANAILEFDPTLISPNQDNFRFISAYR